MVPSIASCVAFEPSVIDGSETEGGATSARSSDGGNEATSSAESSGTGVFESTGSESGDGTVIEPGSTDDGEPQTGDSTSGDELSLPTLAVSVVDMRSFAFTWEPVADIDRYEFVERERLNGVPVAPPQVLAETTRELVIERPVHEIGERTYALRACRTDECSESDPMTLDPSLLNDAIGQFVAENAIEGDAFGSAVAVARDDARDVVTIAIGAPRQNSASTGVHAEQNTGADNSGAVYLYQRDASGHWTASFFKPSNTGVDDRFGSSVALNADGRILAVGAIYEDGDEGGPQADPPPPEGDEGQDVGAVYIFAYEDGEGWQQEAYIKPDRPENGDTFGHTVALSASGRTLAVGAPLEDGATAGVVQAESELDDEALSDVSPNSGAAYVFGRNSSGVWSQAAYIKALNAHAFDRFGSAVSLSGPGDRLAVGASGESVGGDESGAAYLFTRQGQSWTELEYLKAPNGDPYDAFGIDVALSGDGQTLAVGAFEEDSDATGILLTPVTNDGASNAGAVYLYTDADSVGDFQLTQFVKAPDTRAGDHFGERIRLSDDGRVLAIGACGEDSAGIGVNGAMSDQRAFDSGAVYVWARNADDDAWATSTAVYVKSTAPRTNDQFGCALGLGPGGELLVVGAPQDDTGSVSTPNSVSNTGSVFVY